MAEYFRDTTGADTLLFVDNIFRFSQAGSEVSALLGRPYAERRGLPADAGHARWVPCRNGSPRPRKSAITSVQAVYVPADDPTDPRVGHRRSVTSTRSFTSNVRSPKRVFIRRSIRWPRRAAFSIRRTSVRAHYAVARRVQTTLQRYRELQDIIAILGVDELSEASNT